MKLIQQDMLALEEGILFHQVNCQGIMGGGIAASFARKWPELEKAYRENIASCIKNADPEFLSGYHTEDGDILCEGDLANDLMLGRVFVWQSPTPNLYVANIFGQGYISSLCRMTSYDATVDAFERIRYKALFNSSLPLYFPYKMGCGLGGGEWSIYSAIIDHYFPTAIICRHNA